MLERLARIVLRIFFREIDIEGRDRLPEGGAVVFAPNHPNALLDPLFMAFFSPPFRLRFVAKEPLFRIPILGWLMRRWKAIPVLRRFEADGPVDFSAFFEACVQALAEGAAITIFPEGRSLPRPTMSPLKTGPARIYLLARERGITVRIVPVALNYERPWEFRSSVHVTVAESLDTGSYESAARDDLHEAARELTDALGASLEGLVFQADSYRDRGLMLVLERLYADQQVAAPWRERLERLKQFEAGLVQLVRLAPHELSRLREQVSRYARLAGSEAAHRPGSPGDGVTLLRGFLGLPFFLLGALVSWLPYTLCDRLVRGLRHDRAAAGTWKVAYGMLLFPLLWVLEALLLWSRWGAAAALGFALAVVPVSYAALRYMDWHHRTGGGAAVIARWLGGRGSRRKLAVLQTQIVAAVDALAARLE